MGRPERPLDPAAGPIPAFASELRQLRQQAGSPKYLQMQRRTGRSRTAPGHGPQSHADTAMYSPRRPDLPMSVRSHLGYAADLDVRKLVREVLVEGGQGVGVCAVVASRPVRMRLSSAENWSAGSVGGIGAASSAASCGWRPAAVTWRR